MVDHKGRPAAKRGPVTQSNNDDRSKPTHLSPEAQSLKQRTEAAIERELARCERSMSPAQWREHREWITDYVNEEALQWLRSRGRGSR
ncbi:hypothetical protein [Paraburkholderia sp. BR10882]|uniref:hypothetical protein n=1 Tax=unclassified Paraburkholderia TaxID=2615204 RepID=UPI0034CE1DA8